jgi:hypothetical protein
MKNDRDTGEAKSANGGVTKRITLDEARKMKGRSNLARLSAEQRAERASAQRDEDPPVGQGRGPKGPLKRV